jgi:hypothetical protein
MKTKEPTQEAKRKTKNPGIPSNHCNFRYVIERENLYYFFIRGAVSTFTFEIKNISPHNFDISAK